MKNVHTRTAVFVALALIFVALGDGGGAENYNGFYIFLFWVFVALAWNSYSRSKNKNIPHQEKPKEKNYTTTINTAANEQELKKLYLDLLRKYHPDFAQAAEDKAFRNTLTAKINTAYREKDIETLRLLK